jgi:hypothetical protein
MVSSVVAGEWYTLTYSVSFTVGGEVYPTVGGVTLKKTSASILENQQFLAVNSDPLVFTPTVSESRFTIDNISLKKMTSGNLSTVGYVLPSRIGLGTTVPSYQLDIVDDIGSGGTNYGRVAMRGLGGSILQWRFGDDASAPDFAIYKARGTRTSPTIVQNGDTLGNMQFNGYDGSTNRLGAVIRSFVEGTPATNKIPARIAFFTKPDSATAITERMRISSDGLVGIGTTVPAARVHSLSTTEQLRLGYDADNYLSTTVGSTGAVTLDAVGSGQEFIFNDNLDVKSDSGVQLATSGLNLGGAIRTHNETGSSNGIVIEANRLNGKISFVTYLTEKMRLTIDGNLGIGTTAPSAKLHAISTTEQLRLGYDTSNYVSTTVGSSGIVTHDAVGSGSSFVFSDPVIVTPTAAQTIAAGNTITANACGSIKEITAAGAVTTDTTNTFTAPAAANDGCCMDVVNIGAENITLDNNANFVSAGAADVVLGAGDTLRVCSTGASGKWYQIGATGNN